MLLLTDPTDLVYFLQESDAGAASETGGTSQQVIESSQLKLLAQTSRYLWQHESCLKMQSPAVHVQKEHVPAQSAEIANDSLDQGIAQGSVTEQASYTTWLLSLFSSSMCTC